MSSRKQNSDRSKYDMKQALSMRGISAKFSAKQIQTVLRGLDTADSLVVGSAGGGGGNLEEASSLYEHHIGQVIQIINEIKRLEVEGWGSSIGDYTREALEARTRVALTDAEQLKATMNKRGMVKKQLSSHSKNSTSTPSRGLAEKSKSATHLTSQRRIRLAQSKIIPSIQESKSADTTNTNTKQSPPPKGKKINLNYKKADPLIATIKSDMYVDSSTLTTTWDMVAGLKDAKRALQEAAILPILRPDLYSGLRSPPRGILLYGPPGTGKTMLVRAVAHESQCILFACSASAMTSKWVGEGEKLVRTLFRMASDVAPSIIFLDEMDALLGKRKSDSNSEGESSRRFKTEFMVQMEGICAGNASEDTVERRVLLIGCTNCPWDIDDAVMRRFQRRIYVPLPDSIARKALWSKILNKDNGNISISSRDVTKLIQMTEGFSCSDISSIANEAAFGPLRDIDSIEQIVGVNKSDVRPIQSKDFIKAIQDSKKSVSNGLLKKYDTWEKAQAARG